MKTKKEKIEFKLEENEITRKWKGKNIIVSIICPAYNHEKYIKDALNGFLNQKTDFPFEVLVHDDASVDSTQEIIKEYSKHYPIIIRPIFQTKNQFSQGKKIVPLVLPKAKGKYIALCEGDDYWTDPSKLEIQVNFLQKNLKFSGCFHKTQVLYENDQLNGMVYGENAPEIMTVSDTFSTFSPFHTSSFIFRAENIQLPNWINKIVSVDMAIFSIVAGKGNLKKINRVMSTYRKHDEGLTNSNFVKNNFHNKRIELLNLLNEYHGYQYSEQAKRIIDFHSSKSKSKFKRLVETFLEKL